jgi:hypothetical protein
MRPGHERDGLWRLQAPVTIDTDLAPTRTLVSCGGLVVCGLRPSAKDRIDASSPTSPIRCPPLLPDQGSSGSQIPAPAKSRSPHVAPKGPIGPMPGWQSSRGRERSGRGGCRRAGGSGLSVNAAVRATFRASSSSIFVFIDGCSIPSKIACPNQRWSLDFRPYTFGACQKVRILAVNDDCCRENLCLVPDTSICGAKVARKLDALVRIYRKPACIVSDRRRSENDPGDCFPEAGNRVYQQGHPEMGERKQGRMA